MSSMGTYVSPYVKCIAGGNLLNDPGTPGSLLCDYLERGMGREVGGRSKGEGSHVHLWLLHADGRQRPTQFCKVIIFQLKIKSKEENQQQQTEKELGRGTKMMLFLHITK